MKNDLKKIKWRSYAFCTSPIPSHSQTNPETKINHITNPPMVYPRKFCEFLDQKVEKSTGLNTLTKIILRASRLLRYQHLIGGFFFQSLTKKHPKIPVFQCFLGLCNSLSLKHGKCYNIIPYHSNNSQHKKFGLT